MSRRGVSDQTLKALIQRIGPKDKEIKVVTTVARIEKVNIFKMGTITSKKNFN